MEIPNINLEVIVRKWCHLHKSHVHPVLLIAQEGRNHSQALSFLYYTVAQDYTAIQ